jgi:thioredoxin-related protein
MNVADARNADAKRSLGFVSTPHFFFLRADGSAVQEMQGVLPADSLRGALDAVGQGDRPSPQQ